MKFPDDLVAGDILLYHTADAVDAAIEWKEGDDGADACAHIEIYMGHGVSYASRNGIGVNAYDFRPEGLHQVRRPVGLLDRTLVEGWFLNYARGLPYGWGDIAASVNLEPGKADRQVSPTNPTKPGGMDCSHFAAAMLETGKCPQFDPVFPKNKITPRDFKLSRESVCVWRPDAQTADQQVRPT